MFPDMEQQMQSVRQADTEAEIARRLNAVEKPPGFVIGGPVDQSLGTYTVAIMGVPRGGTTMVAGVAQLLGLAIGEDLGHNLEDADFDRKPVPHMIAAAAARDSQRQVWGWKFPSAAKYMGRLQPHLRNPRVVMVWRDPLTAASRKISAVSRLASRPALHTEAVLDGLAFMVERQADNLAYLREAGCPVYLVSYEKALRRPEAFIRQLADFIGIAAPRGCVGHRRQYSARVLQGRKPSFGLTAQLHELNGARLNGN